MAHIVEAKGGSYINLDLVVMFGPSRPFLPDDPPGLIWYTCYSRTFDALGEISLATLQDAKNSTASYLPDTTGTILILFIDGGDLDGKPLLDFIELPVIGWQFIDGLPSPVTVEGVQEDAGGNTLQCLRTTTNQWVFPEDCTCESFDAAKETAIAHFRGRRGVGEAPLPPTSGAVQ